MDPEQQVIYHGQFVVPVGYPRAAANAFMRFSLSRPIAWIPLAVFAFAEIVLIAAATIGGRSPTEPIFLLVILVIIALSYVFHGNSLARRLSVSALPGAVYEVTLTATTLSVRTPTASSSVLYGYYEKADVRGDFLFLKLRGARIRSILPRQLFTDDWLDWVRAQIEGPAQAPARRA